MNTGELSLPKEASPLTRYHWDLAQGNLQADEGQKNAVVELEALYQSIKKQHVSPKKGIFAKIFGSNRDHRPSKQGLYVWGPVGRGKTYLVDTFFESLPFPDKQRIHFHSFMRAVHAELKKYPQEQNPLRLVARQWSETFRVLCLDEFHVGDITDAMILGNLLEALLDNGMILLTTSNDTPSDLYKDGLQRERFLPAIALIENRLSIIELSGPTDYRLRALEQAQVYYCPHGAKTDEQLAVRFKAVAGKSAEGGSLLIEGRHIETRLRAEGAAWFEFSALCEGPRSVADYIEIALCHHTIFISEVPLFDNENNDAARRFINLIDELYDRHVNLIISAAAAPEALYSGTRLNKFFLRTVSRLREMQSHEYLARPHLSE